MREQRQDPRRGLGVVSYSQSVQPSSGARLRIVSAILVPNPMNTTVPPASLNPPTTDYRAAAIVSYLTLVGFIVAVILHSSNKTQLGAYHLRQSLGLMLTGAIVWLAVTMFAFLPFVGWATSLVVWGALFTLWVIGLISAINGQMKPVPFLGEHYQKWFGAAFD